MQRLPLALAFLFALVATSCGGSSGGDVSSPSEEADLAAVRALREDMFQAGIPPVWLDPPEVSDELFTLGQALFFDKILSGSEDVSCATCHLPRFATGDGRNLSRGVHGIGLGPDRGEGIMIPRNSPALFALHLRPELFWDGRIRRIQDIIFPPPAVTFTLEQRAVFLPRLDVMAAQAMLPPVSREEMRGLEGDNDLGDLPNGYNSPGGTPGSTDRVWDALMDRLLSLPAYSELIRDAYPDTQDLELDFAHMGNAIAAFEAQAFARTDSPFDRFMRGDDTALTHEEIAGGREFLEAGCASCHRGPLLSDLGYHNTGLPQFGPGVQMEPTAGPASGNAGRDFGRELATALPGDRFKFRTASLLNVELTAPYGHAGQFATLRAVVEHYKDVELSNIRYNILEHVTDPELIDTLQPAYQEVLANLDPRLSEPMDFDVDAILTFLRALTADDARDLTDLVPDAVPSGLPLF